MARLIVFDRSRREAAENCLRKRWWGYEYQDVGLEKRAQSIHQLVGKEIHEGLAEILGHVTAKTSSTYHFVRGLALGHAMKFRDAVKANGLQVFPEEGAMDEAAKPASDYLVEQYAAMIQAYILAWFMVRYEKLLSEYEVVAVEQEEEVVLREQFLFLSRPDALLKRRADGNHFVLNFKTVSDPNKYWMAQWRYDQQVISEVLPIEARLGEKLGGVIIEGLNKGKQNVQFPKDSGQWVHNSPLLLGWKKKGGEPFPDEYAVRYEWKDEEGTHRLGKGWERFAVWSDPIGVEGWVEWLYEHERELIEQQFIPLPPIIRTEAEVEEWVESATTGEETIHMCTDLVRMAPDEEKDRALMRLFPKSTGSGNCISPGVCPFHDLCWAVTDVDDMYVARTPNHPKEVDVRLEEVTSGRKD